MRILHTDTGREVRIGAEVGRGGEGVVYTISGTDDVAKIFHEDLRLSRRGKVEAMVKRGGGNLVEFVAWPSQCLFESGVFCGYVMRRIPSGFRPVHELYGPSSRVQNFPGKDWRFLLRAAENLANAVSELHDQGLVVGDLNHTNVLVNGDALIFIIDADSFQVCLDGQVHRCDVAVAEFTPPELQGVDLKSRARTPGHDAFALGVLLFELVFMGRHPFAGRPVGGPALALPDAIRLGLYAYSLNGSGKVEAPPNCLHPADVGDSMARCFDECFTAEPSRIGNRPAPHRWAEVLRNAQASLRRCEGSRYHWHPSSADSCIWCEFLEVVGLDYFPEPDGGASRPPVGLYAEVDETAVKSLWDTIAGVAKRPGGADALANRIASVPPLPPLVPRAGWEVSGSTRWVISAIVLGLAMFVSPLAALGGVGGALLWAALGSSLRTRSLNHEANRAERKELEAKHQQRHAVMIEILREQQILKACIAEHEAQWDRVTQELSLTHTELDNGVRLRDSRLKAVKEELISTQREAFLKRHRISDARISGFGPALTMVLASYGVETAHDVLAANSAGSAPGSLASAGTTCPRCGRSMDRRVARKGRYVGRQFWGCTAYPMCNGTRPIGSSIGSQTSTGLSSIPGIGPSRSADLRAWARRVEANFTAVVRPGDLEREEVRIRAGHDQRLKHLYGVVSAGPTRLTSLNDAFHMRATTTVRRLEEMFKALN